MAWTTQMALRRWCEVALGDPSPTVKVCDSSCGHWPRHLKRSADVWDRDESDCQQAVGGGWLEVGASGSFLDSPMS
jgi:hypothetical protein